MKFKRFLCGLTAVATAAGILTTTLYIERKQNAYAATVITTDSVNGFKYTFYSDYTATLVSATPVGNKLDIPREITYGEKTYMVTAIGNGSNSVLASNTQCDSVTIPDTVTEINTYAFYECKGLSGISIPNSVTTIGERAFCGCSNLSGISIPDSVTTIGERAFEKCTKLSNITLSNTLTEISDFAFFMCENLSGINIPNNVTKIGTCAFASSGIKSATIPANVNYMGNGIFQDCKELTTVTFNNTPTEITEEMFSGCEKLKTISIPDSVTSIGDSAFENCRALTSLKIPNGVETIGNSAFCGSGLTSLTIPGSVKSIGYSAFYSEFYDEVNNTRKYPLTSVVIENGITSIDDDLFSCCAGLTSVTIPDSVTSIGDNAFSYCEKLTSITIPDSVTSIGYGAFSYCEKLTSITIPDSVTSIDYGAFSGCSGLTSVKISKNVQSIPSNAFSGCSGLTSVKIPDGVTSIGSEAFSGCDNLLEVSIPAGLSELGENAFESGIKIKYGGTEEQWNNLLNSNGISTIYTDVEYSSTSEEPSAPTPDITGLKCDSTGNDSANISWDAAADITRYVFKINCLNHKELDNANCPTNDKFIINPKPDGNNKINITLSRLCSNKQYTFSVAAVGSDNSTGNFSFVNFTTSTGDGSSEQEEPINIDYESQDMADYTVEHYKQNPKAKTEDGYTLAETQKLTGPVGAKATPTPKTYDGMVFNAEKSKDTKSGTITVDGKLTLKLYYDYTSDNDDNSKDEDPESSDPESSNPESSEPESSNPESSNPESSEPESSEPESSEPETTEPEISVPDNPNPPTGIAAFLVPIVLASGAVVIATIKRKK